MSKKVNNEVISHKPFDLQEAVILLDVYLSFNKKGSTNIEAAEIASQRLRKLAHDRGMIISETFRSTKGIQNRLRSIGHVYEGSESLSAPGTQVFLQAVELYKNNIQKYQSFLNEVKNEDELFKSNQEKMKAVEKTSEQDLSKKANDEVVSHKPFDLQEAVILLDVYLSFNKKGSTNTEAAEIASQKLRKLAHDRGMIISETFRSTKGIQNRLCSIGQVYEGSESLSDQGTQVFLQAVELYKNNIQKYQSFLNEVKNEDELFKSNQEKMKAVEKTSEQDFLAWLSISLPSPVSEELRRSVPQISAMLVKKRVIPKQLLSTEQVEPIENALRLTKEIFGNKKMRNNAQKLLSAYLTYLRNKDEIVTTEHETLDISIHEDWIRFNFTNFTQFERTIPVHCSIKGQKLAGKNWARILVNIAEQEIENKNPALDLLYNQSLLANKKNRPFFLKEKIYGLNCSELSNGYWLNVNYSIPQLMNQIQALCFQCGYSKNDVIIYGMPKTSDTEKNADLLVPKSNGNDVSIEMAEAHLKSVGLQGATVQVLIDEVQPEATANSMKNALETSNHIIEMPCNRYVHVDSFVDLDEAKNGINHILKTHFAHFGGYSNNKLLFGAASHELSMFLNDNDCEDIDSVYALAQFFFGRKSTDEKYRFSYPHIFEIEPNYPLTLKGLMINLARKNSGVLNSEDAKNFLQKTMLSYGSIGQLLQISSSDTFISYDSERYLLTEKIGIDKEWIQAVHNRLDNLFREANVAYVIPRDIKDTWMNTLPNLPQSLHWTALLLQEVLRNFPDVGFRSITSELGQARGTIAAAIVPTNSPLQSFPDVVTLYMQDKHTLPKRMACEELRQELCAAGMLEGNELIYALPKALNDYRFSWTDENKMVLVRGN